MGRKRSPNRDKSFEIFKENNGNITSKEIAHMLNEKINNINNWRVQDRWRRKITRIGAPIGNKNAVGNKGGAPKENINSFKYGNYTKRIPMAITTVMQELDVENPLEKLWRGICLQEARIIYMQNIMHVKSNKDTTKVLKKKSTGKIDSKEWEIQFAWDKEANLINTQSKALDTLTKMIKRYEDMIHANWDMATEEQKLRVENLKTKIVVTKEDIRNRKELNDKKLYLEREKFEHQRSIDDKRYW